MSRVKNHPFSSLLWIALIITALRIFYLLINQRNLDVDEAQYWSWSRHLALGYHSKPPMISWAIYFSTRLFGDQEWAIRILSPVTYFFTALFVYGCAKKLFNPQIGFWSGISVLVLPAVTYSASIISTDPFLILFWSLALMAFTYAYQTRGPGWWLLCGVAIGLGTLSKYTMLAFLLSAILYFICNVHRRSPLKSFGPYLTLIVALLIFLPNAIWNTHHHNPALEHVVEHNIHVQGIHFHWENLTYFFLSQIGILGPVLFIFLIIAILRRRRLDQPEASLLLLCFTIPMLLLVSVEALLSRAYTNWAAVAYPSGIILTVAYMWERNRRGWLKFSVVLNLIILVILYAWEIAIAYGWLNWPLPDRPNWKDFGSKIQEQQRLYPNLSYLVDDRELWSKSLYYGKVSKNRLFIWDPQKNIDWKEDSPVYSVAGGKSFVFISTSAQLSPEMARVFQNSRLLDEFTVNQRLSGRQKQIYILIVW